MLICLLQILSTDGGTPNTEIRAMLREQDELYNMLGMSLGRLRRSHSVIGLSGNPELQPYPQTTMGQPATRRSRLESLESNRFSRRVSRSQPRPASYPSSLDVYDNPVDAD